jgi:hypothetical protein
MQKEGNMVVRRRSMFFFVVLWAMLLISGLLGEGEHTSVAWAGGIGGDTLPTDNNDKSNSYDPDGGTTSSTVGLWDLELLLNLAIMIP